MSSSDVILAALTSVTMAQPTPATPARAPRAPAVSEAQAHELALSTLVSWARRLPQTSFEHLSPERNADRFYWFQILAETGADRSPNLGFYAVNKATGDVWEIPACERRRSAAISRWQQGLPRRAGVSAREIRRLSAIAPCEP